MSDRGRDHCRTLEELAKTPEFAAIVERELPRFRGLVGSFDRRPFLQLMAVSMALGGLARGGQIAQLFRQFPGSNKAEIRSIDAAALQRGDRPLEFLRVV
jgi:MoCo/4Fe-4S cofactor protein with predicted Tat translocation signal